MVENDGEKERLQNLVKSCLLEINKLKMDLAKLEKEKELLKKDDKVQKLEASIKEKENEIAFLKNDLIDLETSLNGKEDVIKKQELRIKDLSNLKESFDDIKIAILKDLNSFKIEEIKEHNEELKSSLSAVVEIDTEIKSLITEFKSYKEKIIDSKDNIPSENDISKLQREIDAKDNEITVLKAATVDENTLKSLKNEIENKENQIKEFEKIKESFDEIKTSYESSLDTKDKRIEELEEIQTSFDEVKTSYESRLDIKDKRIEELEEIQASFDEVKTSYEGRLVNKDKRIEDLEQIKSSFEDIKTSLRNDIKAYKSKDLEETNSKLQVALDKLVEKDNKIKSLVEELDDKNLEIKRLETNNIPKIDYDKLKEEMELKDIRIQKLEEIKGLFSDLDKSQSKKSKSSSLSKMSSIPDDVSKIISEPDNIKDIEKSNKIEVENLKKELKSCREANKDLEKIKDYYEKLTSSPKSDLTSFQSQIYNLIPDKPMTSQEIHGYVREIAFKEISYKNIDNIIRGLERRGYLKFEDSENSAEGNWVKTDKK